MITIGEPYLEEEIQTSRLCARIQEFDKKKVFYFEVPKEYGKYLCTEVSDAFLVGLLNYAFSTGQDIKVEGEVSERLLYQLETYFLKTLPVVRNKYYKKINIDAKKHIGKIENIGAVGTSASGGVDSFYSIVKHIGGEFEHYNLTHLLIANQFNYYKSENETREKFQYLIEDIKAIPQNYGLKLIPIYTNHSDFLFDGFVQEYSLRICSYSLALQKLFSVYYVSSGVPFREFDFANHDSDGFDIFNLALLTTDSLTFYSSGGELIRTQKLSFIADDQFIQNNLKVCNDNNRKNCSKCEKCMRTMLSLDIVGKLDMFSSVFDLERYRRQKNQYLAVVESNTIEACTDLLESIKIYGYKVPVLSKIKGKLYIRIKWNIKNILKSSIFLHDFYYKMKLDFMVHGKKKAIVYRYGTKYEIK